MGTRWNGADLQEDLACEQGLMRRLPSRKAKGEEILLYFELMRRVRTVAGELSRRDDELIEAVLRCGNLSGAARSLSPERADILRCYLSQRLKKFKQLSEILFRTSPVRAPRSKDGHDSD